MSDADFADPLEQDIRPERVNYANGQMLDVSDFQDEQSYHRSRLARFIKYLVGHGTLAGLLVTSPDAKDEELELRVAPGIGVDRYGRLIEVEVPQCIRLARWFDDRGDEELGAAIHGGSRVPDGDAVVADLFMSAHMCGRGKTPAFATGPFDALDAVISSRLAEQAKLELILRKEGGPAAIPTPENGWPQGNVSIENRRKAVLGSWDEGSAHRDSNGPNPFAEHVLGHDPSAIFLARIFIPVQPPGDGETRPRLQMSRRVIADNSARPVIFMRGKWFGRPVEDHALVQPES